MFFTFNLKDVRLRFSQSSLISKIEKNTQPYKQLSSPGDGSNNFVAVGEDLAADEGLEGLAPPQRKDFIWDTSKN